VDNFLNLNLAVRTTGLHGANFYNI